jgi:cell division protein FtsW
MSNALTAHLTPDLAIRPEAVATSADGSGQYTGVWITAVAAGLMGIGAVMTFSASTSIDHPPVVWPIWQHDAIRQLTFVTAGLFAMLVVSRVPYMIWSVGRGYGALFLLVGSLAICGLVLVPGLGVEVNGAVRWLRIPGTGFRFQPSELVKGALPIFLANWVVYRVDIRCFWRGLLPIVMIIGVCVGGIGLEDFGTAALLAGVSGCLLLVAGARIWHLLLMVLPAIPAFGYLLMSRSHRMERLLIYRDPFQDPAGKGYQVIQSLCTIVSGGWWGRGLGNGFGKGYLPEARNDFIFAVICEELGVVGAAAVIALLITLMWLGRRVVVKSSDPVGRLLALGIILTLGFQAAMNIAVVTASVPTKGIALPLVSAGGSGAIFLGALVGVLANVARRTSLQTAPRE